MNYLLLYFLASALFFLAPVSEQKQPGIIAVYPVCRVLEGHFGSFIGSATYLTKTAVDGYKTALYFLSVDHLAKRGHPRHPLLVELSGGQKAILHYVWNNGELSLLVCFLSQPAISPEVNIAIADPPRDSRVIIEGFIGNGVHCRVPGTVKYYDTCCIKDGSSIIREQSVYIETDEFLDYGGASGGAIYYEDRSLAAIFWAKTCFKKGKSTECYEVMGIPAGEIRKRLASIKESLPPDFVRRTFGNQEPAAK